MNLMRPDSALRCEIGRLRTKPTSWRTVARRWFWRFIRRWETEICGACGRPVCARDLSWWRATDELWRAAGRAEADIRCLSCFTEECRRAGYAVHWEPVVDCCADAA